MNSKYVMITGISTGIGFALCTFFIEKGYHVIGTVRNEEDKSNLKNTFNKNLTILCFDVRNTIKMNIEFESIAPLLSKDGLYCVINNAGVAIPGPLELMDEELFDAQLDINVKAVRRITNAVLPYLKVKTPGKIINISSVSGLVNMPYNGAYCISKHALESMTEVYRRELLPFGISVSAVQPGPIKTPIWKKNLGSMKSYYQSEYGSVLQKADKIIENTEKNALDTSAVVKKVWKIFNEKNSSPLNIVHKKKWGFMLFWKLIPRSIADKLIYKTLQKGDNFRPF